jgi:hypothetical protein
MHSNYHVQASERLVESWSIQRLPFEARGWKGAWRDELKNALRDIGGARGGDFLAARYESPVCDYASDAENILFYNLSGAFAASTRNGMRFERLYNVSPCPIELSAPANHYQRYALANARGAFHGWRESTVLAELVDVELPWLKWDSSPALVWFPLRAAAITVRRAAAFETPFALRLRIEVPERAGAAANIAKPLIDGVVSAFQAHDGWRGAEIAAWMERRFGFAKARVQELLEEEAMSALGRRRLFNAFRDGFVFAPDDDRCVAGEVEIARVTGRTGFRLSGTVCAAEPAAQVAAAPG